MVPWRAPPLLFTLSPRQTCCIYHVSQTYNTAATSASQRKTEAQGNSVRWLRSQLSPGRVRTQPWRPGLPAAKSHPRVRHKEPKGNLHSRCGHPNVRWSQHAGQPQGGGSEAGLPLEKRCTQRPEQHRGSFVLSNRTVGMEHAARFRVDFTQQFSHLPLPTQARGTTSTGNRPSASTRRAWVRGEAGAQRGVGASALYPALCHLSSTPCGSPKPTGPWLGLNARAGTLPSSSPSYRNAGSQGPASCTQLGQGSVLSHVAFVWLSQAKPPMKTQP